MKNKKRKYSESTVLNFDKRPASKGPNKEEVDFNFFFYSLNYICQEKTWKCYHIWVQNDNAARELIKSTINSSQWGHVSGAGISKDI